MSSIGKNLPIYREKIEDIEYKKDKNILCNKCRYLDIYDDNFVCTMPHTISISPINGKVNIKRIKRADPNERNSLRDCKFFEKKKWYESITIHFRPVYR